MAKIKETKTKVSVRKAPRIIPFVASAGVVGLLVSLITAWSIQASASFFGLVVAYGTAIFMALGLALVLVLDAISHAKAKTLEATKLER
ncbi:MAG: hypothetical protein ACKOWR_03660 [Micrococcales bacterium]